MRSLYCFLGSMCIIRRKFCVFFFATAPCLIVRFVVGLSPWCCFCPAVIIPSLLNRTFPDASSRRQFPSQILLANMPESSRERMEKRMWKREKTHSRVKNTQINWLGSACRASHIFLLPPLPIITSLSHYHHSMAQNRWNGKGECVFCSAHRRLDMPANH